jgi:hypothetical protein
MEDKMSKVKFTKWYPFTKELPRQLDFEWDEIKSYTHDDEWLRIVNFLITWGFYVGIHWNVDSNLITIMVDITWFNRR